MYSDITTVSQATFISNNLKEKNLKVTTQRVAIYSYLLNSTEHPTAEKVYSTLKPSNPSLSLGTVYKTLEAFKSNGLILGFNIGESKFRYDGNVKPHTHFYCNCCETVYDIFTSPSFDDKDLDGFEIDNFQGFLYGTCKNCK